MNKKVRRIPPMADTDKGLGNRHDFYTSHIDDKEPRTEDESKERPKITIWEGSRGITIEANTFTLPTLTDIQAFQELLGRISDRIQTQALLGPYRPIKLRLSAPYGKLGRANAKAKRG